ncbi:MAG: hypothetical protein RL253_1262, partial [Bacteroidota bacterium]
MLQIYFYGHKKEKGCVLLKVVYNPNLLKYHTQPFYIKASRWAWI